ncbi:MAG TPA: hypothetical protein PKV86_03375 [Syntrophobacteraceae bacterium]|nr:hypothetical protein [Syntrophobacteraceae bacterium]
MKAGIIFTGTGPILILTTYDSLKEPRLAEKLVARGMKKFIAFEVPVDMVKKRYGTLFSIVLGDLSQTDDLRILDIDGHHVFMNFSFDEMGEPFYFSS